MRKDQNIQNPINKLKKKYKLPIKVFDFFSGCGGASKGFQNAGMEIVFAIDNDPDADKTFKKNFPNSHFLLKDIKDLTTSDLQSYIDNCKGNPILFSGCAPCQPFTKQNTKRKDKDKRKKLLNEFKRFVEHFKPEYVFVENVPGLQNILDEEGPFKEFLTTLSKLEYHTLYDVIAAKYYGVPQKRSRLILIASRLGKIEFCSATHGPNTKNTKYATVRNWIGDLPPIKAGETDPADTNHRAASLSPTNLERIMALSEGEDRRNWPDHLILVCHSNDYTGHTDVYGRMSWDEPASGLTTRCISLSNGRFGHPEQNRAISVREAACLQTFPRDFIFYGSLNSMARQIGNALPVILAEHFGKNFIKHFKTYTEGFE